LAYSSILTSVLGQVQSAAFLKGKPPRTPEVKML
jgi:hypothetical protein